MQTTLVLLSAFVAFYSTNGLPVSLKHFQEIEEMSLGKDGEYKPPKNWMQKQNDKNVADSGPLIMLVEEISNPAVNGDEIRNEDETDIENKQVMANINEKSHRKLKSLISGRRNEIHDVKSATPLIESRSNAKIEIGREPITEYKVESDEYLPVQTQDQRSLLKGSNNFMKREKETSMVSKEGSLGKLAFSETFTDKKANEESLTPAKDLKRRLENSELRTTDKKSIILSKDHEFLTEDMQDHSDTQINGNEPLEFGIKDNANPGSVLDDWIDPRVVSDNWIDPRSVSDDYGDQKYLIKEIEDYAEPPPNPIMDYDSLRNSEADFLPENDNLNQGTIREDSGDSKAVDKSFENKHEESELHVWKPLEKQLVKRHETQKSYQDDENPLAIKDDYIYESADYLMKSKPDEKYIANATVKTDFAEQTTEKSGDPETKITDFTEQTTEKSGDPETKITDFTEQTTEKSGDPETNITDLSSELYHSNDSAGKSADEERSEYQEKLNQVPSISLSTEDDFEKRSSKKIDHEKSKHTSKLDTDDGHEKKQHISSIKEDIEESQQTDNQTSDHEKSQNTSSFDDDFDRRTQNSSQENIGNKEYTFELDNDPKKPKQNASEENRIKNELTSSLEDDTDMGKEISSKEDIEKRANTSSQIGDHKKNENTSIYGKDHGNDIQLLEGLSEAEVVIISDQDCLDTTDTAEVDLYYDSDEIIDDESEDKCEDYDPCLKSSINTEVYFDDDYRRKKRSPKYTKDDFLTDVNGFKRFNFPEFKSVYDPSLLRAIEEHERNDGETPVDRNPKVRSKKSENGVFGEFESDGSLNANSNYPKFNIQSFMNRSKFQEGDSDISPFAPFEWPATLSDENPFSREKETNDQDEEEKREIKTQSREKREANNGPVPEENCPKDEYEAELYRRKMLSLPALESYWDLFPKPIIDEAGTPDEQQANNEQLAAEAIPA